MVPKYSLRLNLIVILGVGTSIKKCKGKSIEKVSGMWNLFFYVSFIIKCD